MKPEYPKHRKVRRVSRDARLLNIHLWNLADDEGRLRELPRWIIGEVFPTDDDVTPQLLGVWLDELEQAGLICRYEVDGERYVACHDFADHQAINRKTDSVLPAPGSLTEGSVNGHGALRDASHREGKGREGKGSTPSDQSDQVLAVFNAWVEATGRTERTLLSEKRRRLIRKALKDYSPDEVVAAVRGWRHSSFHRGENDRGRPFNDIELLLRDAKHIEEFRDLEQAHGGRQHSWDRFLGEESVAA